MAFENAETKRVGVERALTLLHQVRQIYQTGKIVQQLLADYQGATDPVLVAAVNALYTPAERVELGQMLGQIDTLVTAWETNHGAALGV